jgi:hypothetical protein
VRVSGHQQQRGEQHRPPHRDHRPNRHRLMIADL